MNFLFLTVGGGVVAALALGFAVAALVRRAKLQAVAMLPVAPEASVHLPAGDLVLHLSGPFGKRGMGGLSFELLDPAGIRVPSRAIVTRSLRSSATGGVLLSVRRFSVPAPGAYWFLVSGMSPDRDLSDCALVLARPAGAGLVLAIVAVVVSAVTLLVCTVFSLILWLSPEAFVGIGTGG